MMMPQWTCTVLLCQVDSCKPNFSTQVTWLYILIYVPLLEMIQCNSMDSQSLPTHNSSASSPELQYFILGTNNTFFSSKMTSSITSYLKILGEGSVTWKVILDYSKVYYLCPRTYQILGLMVQLLCPQDLMTIKGGQHGSWMIIEDTNACLNFCRTGQPNIEYNKIPHLPMILICP